METRGAEVPRADLRLADVKNPYAVYRVTRWAFGKNGKDETTVIYNTSIPIQDVPFATYYHVVIGKPGLEWVMERHVVKVGKDSGIDNDNDANRYAIETMNNPAYPLELFQRVITVSLRTTEIVRDLPKLEVL